MRTKSLVKLLIELDINELNKTFKKLSWDTFFKLFVKLSSNLRTRQLQILSYQICPDLSDNENISLIFTYSDIFTFAKDIKRETTCFLAHS